MKAPRRVTRGSPLVVCWRPPMSVDACCIVLNFVTHNLPPAKSLAVVQKLRRERLDQQRENLEGQRDLVANQIDSMVEELDLQRRRVTLYEKQLAATEVLNARGLATQDRVGNRQTDLMNAQLLVVRLLSEKAEAEGRLVMIDSLINELETDWTLGLTNELNDAQNTAVAARNALDLARRDLEVSEQVLGIVTVDSAAQAYMIHRQSDGEMKLVAAEPDMAVLPGDIIQVVRK